MEKKTTKKLIAVTILVSIFMTLFLSCHFRIWSGTYCDGDLESATVGQEILIAHADNDADAQHTSDFHVPVLSFPSETGIINIFILIFAVVLIFFEFRQCITLCSMSIRMNN